MDRSIRHAKTFQRPIFPDDFRDTNNVYFIEKIKSLFIPISVCFRIDKTTLYSGRKQPERKKRFLLDGTMESKADANSIWSPQDSWDQAVESLEEPALLVSRDGRSFSDPLVVETEETKPKKPSSPIYMIVFDCELTGPCLKKNALINLGASCINCSTGKELSSVDLFLAVSKGKEWDQETVEKFWNKQDHLRELKRWIDAGNGKSCEEAMKDFVDFLKRCYEISKGDICIAADHGDIDASWVNLYLAEAGYPPLHLIFGNFLPVISLYSYYLGVSQHTLESWVATKRIVKKFSSTEAVMRHLMLKTRPNATKHHLALSDARAEIFNYRCIAPFLQHMKKSGNHSHWFQTFCRLAHQTFIPTLQLSSAIEFPPLKKTH